MSENMNKVAVVMGSKSDLPIMTSCINMLKELGLEPVVRIISAHRTPQAAAYFSDNAAAEGIKVIIAAAGMAAHLAGSIAGRTSLPVVGVPMNAKDGPDGLDALLSTVQMPPGIPVASMAIGGAGAKNAAIFAAQIVALFDAGVSQRLEAFRAAQTQAVLDTDASLEF
ncbi:MAG: 5-(carboxyamino)imidazole ribonucleotide mutase [Phycisphaerae bacterium]|jgi:phosphoribosylaminoimidazole carboxylase PurE protein